MSDPENTDPIATLRAELLRDLPDDIKRVRNAYRRAAQQAALLREARDFNAHQAACKTALGHLDGLIKLLRWASEGTEDTISDDTRNGQISSTDRLIGEARSALSAK